MGRLCCLRSLGLSVIPSFIAKKLSLGNIKEENAVDISNKNIGIQISFINLLNEIKS